MESINITTFLQNMIFKFPFRCYISLVWLLQQYLVVFDEKKQNKDIDLRYVYVVDTAEGVC